MTNTKSRDAIHRQGDVGRSQGTDNAAPLGRAQGAVLTGIMLMTLSLLYITRESPEEQSSYALALVDDGSGLGTAAFVLAGALWLAAISAIRKLSP